ncbi:hypothetical protein INT45_002086 [Circinella minor]|uniref:Uncharacterized protein n=1 Tax=Circinella minor TaxID=1195481 RepID=A0A8H7SGU1_9FUNG|nr:hypothetical protein INT45_002086 [Circinella minor]
MTPSTMDCFSSNNKKRKNDDVVELDTSTNTSTCFNNNNRPIIAPIGTKRHHNLSAQSDNQQEETPTFKESYFMPNQQSQLPPRSTTPPLSMTLSHSNSNGGYATSVVKSANEHSSTVCSGMTPVYRPAAERWGSSFL